MNEAQLRSRNRQRKGMQEAMVTQSLATITALNPLKIKPKGGEGEVYAIAKDGDTYSVDDVVITYRSGQGPHVVWGRATTDVS